MAIDLRVLRFGYAVFEGPKQLLDWGCKAYTSGEVAARRTADLLKLFHPSVVIVRSDRRTGVRNIPAVATILRSVKDQAAVRSIPVCILTPEEIREAFLIFGAKTKDEIALALARIFPELFWKLPPKRKRWQNEHPRYIVFDAIAVGVTYHQHCGIKTPPPE